MPTSTTVQVPGPAGARTLKLTNLDKPLYPDGTTKGQVVAYYAAMADILLPHLTGRPATLVRWPDGTDGPSFFAKNAPKGTPDWVRTVRLPAPGSSKGREEIDYVVVEEPATLVWAANLAGLEIHVPQWQVGPRGAVRDPDLLVVDLDPGAPADALDCARVALAVRERLEADPGGPVVVKSSGSKGLQVYCRWPGAGGLAAREAAHALAVDLERAMPELVVSRMTKSLRAGRVLVDWSQNNPAKTTVAPYSLRGKARPTVSAPLRWEELAAATDAAELLCTVEDMPARLARDGDLFAPLLAGLPARGGPDV